MRAICNEVEALVKKCGKPKMLDAVKLPPPELYKHVEVCFMTSLLFNKYHLSFSIASNNLNFLHTSYNAIV